MFQLSYKDTITYEIGGKQASWVLEKSQSFLHLIELQILNGLTQKTVRIRRKSKQCLNCGHTLSEVYNWCPNCGQENNDHNVKLSTLIAEFFSNYFGVDSRFWGTFKPFFFQPGYLTNQFNNGKRKSFVHPIRLYLVVSLIYFFVLGLVGNQSGSWQSILANSNNGDDVKVKLTGPDDGAGYGFNLTTPDTTMTFNPVDSIMKEIDTNYVSQEEVMAMVDSVVQNSNQLTFNQSSLKETLFILRDINLSDSVARDSLGWVTVAMREFRQARKIAQSDLHIFVSSIIQNIPIMMFFMIPIFAALLSLWYVRRKFLYIKHLIHGLHLHALAYWVFSLATLIMIFLITSAQGRLWVGLIAFLLVTVYSAISFKKVYHQSWRKTLLKFFLQGWVYAGVLFFAAIVALTVTFYLY
ncbi:MAG: DUF3667 domain-containing protein [Bacteroidota bacterium]